MRNVALALLTAGGLAMVGAAPAMAQTYAPGYPVCLHVYGPISYYECSYTSLPQCNASASGRPAQCVLNPYYASAEEPIRRPYRRHRSVY